MPKASFVGMHTVQLCQALRLEDFHFALSPTKSVAQPWLSLSAKRADVFSPREEEGMDCGKGGLPVLGVF